MELCYNKKHNKALRDGNLKGLLITTNCKELAMTASNNTRNIERGQSHMPLGYSTEEIIERFKKKHGDRYDYSLVHYIGSDRHVSIICKKHGVFEQRVDQHAKGNNCPRCMKTYKPTNEEFIAECKKIHGDKFDYSKTKYKNARSKLLVVCQKHGDFEVLPRSHKASPSGGCTSCSCRKKVTLDDFVRRSNNIHDFRYSYKKIKTLKNTRQKVLITCSKHGDFLQIADRHLHGNGCPECGNEVIREKSSMGLEEFVRRASETHSDKYDYSKANYKNGYTKVLIICPDHGEFWQRPHGHLQTRGCKQCGDESKFNFRRAQYIKHAKNHYKGKASLYLIKCTSQDEVFYKIGITMLSIEDRFKSVIPYDYEVVHEVRSSVDFVWDLENRLHEILKRHAYRPKLNFGGVTECFEHIPKSVIKLLNDIKESEQLPLLA